MPPRKVSAEQRFWPKVDKAGPIPEHCPELGPCWMWIAHVNRHRGYGHFNAGGREGYAHRFAYELLVGPIPDGLELDHLCRVRHCVNPAHLEPVTRRENVLRGQAPSAYQARQTCCIRGHLFNAENTYIRPDNGARQCRTCRRLREAGQVR